MCVTEIFIVAQDPADFLPGVDFDFQRGDAGQGVADGDAVTFQIVGDLTITGITREVVFDVTATFLSGSQISGTATTEVMRADYELEIPSVSGVANVSEEVRIEIDFVADALN